VVVACLCSLMSISLLPDELVKKLLGGQQRITSIAHLIIRDPTDNRQPRISRVQQSMMTAKLARRSLPHHT
ncbi:hypothetical protein K9O32_17060, partial [Chromohalobacter salexigens]